MDAAVVSEIQRLCSDCQFDMCQCVRSDLSLPICDSLEERSALVVPGLCHIARGQNWIGPGS